MPTVLIADDNSNIQKMVALALKSGGGDIEVVAVGNGEAAIRKAREIIPDLVLADIFMPVRGGYEVCELVKADTRLSHIPVVLLAGAFDPFDEPEARRVGADGVLKKPFVPADPLISLVKELLAKHATSVLVPVAAQAEAVAPAREIADSKPVIAPISFEVPASSEIDQDVPSKGFSLPSERFGSSDEKGALAFGSAIEAPSEIADETHFSAPAAPQFTSDDDPEEGIHDDARSSSWSPFVSAPASIPEEVPAVFEDEPAKSLRDSFGKTWAMEPATPSHPEEETIVEPLDRFTAMHYVPPVVEQSKTELVEEKAPEVASGELDEFTTSNISREDWEPNVPESSAQQAQALEFESSPAMPWHISSIDEGHAGSPSSDPTPEQDSFPQQVVEATPEIEPHESHETVEPVAQVSVPFDFSKFDLAYPAQHEPEPPTEEPVETHSSNEEFVAPSESAIPQSSGTPEQNAEASSFPVPTPAPMDPRTIEEIVSRVIDRLQPQLMEMISREILRPVVESLVRRQLDSE